MRSRWGWKSAAARVTLVTVGVGLGVILPPIGFAGAAPSYSGVAAADAVRVTVVVPGAPLSSSLFDGGAWSSQAVMTSSGSSEAFASNPYPGESIVTLPGTLAGAGVAGVPEYPLYAGSSYPQKPHAEVGHGPFRLAADST